MFTKCLCIFFGRAFWKVDPLWSPIRQLPGSLGSLNPTFVQQRLPPELPRASGTLQGKEPTRGPTFSQKICVLCFWAALFEKSGLLGSCLVDCLACWEVSGHSSSNKACPQSSQGPLGPTRGLVIRFLGPPGPKFSADFLPFFHGPRGPHGPHGPKGGDRSKHNNLFFIDKRTTNRCQSTASPSQSERTAQF